MALVLNVNSYGEVSGADTYFADSLRSGNWKAISSSTRAKALIEATRYLERLSWKGVKTVSDQPLHFPIDEEVVVPTPIIEATYEVALRLAEDPTLIDSIRNQSQAPVKRVKADTVEVEFVTSGVSVTKSQLFDWVQVLVKDYLSGGGGFSAAGSGIATGTDTCSSFTENYNRSGGYA